MVVNLLHVMLATFLCDALLLVVGIPKNLLHVLICAHVPVHLH